MSKTTTGGRPTASASLTVPALRVRQGKDRVIFTFAIDGKMLDRIATVSRIRRGEEQELFGYQRPEVYSHIREIRHYLESDRPMIPNAIVVAFDDSVSFVTAPGRAAGEYSEHGELVIPLRSEGAELPGWIVDGQQRAAAIREAEIDSFPICVSAFIADDHQEQREQFILVNSTKPLPRSLIYELLPATNSKLPSNLQKRRYPAYLLNRLNSDPDSPFFELIKSPTTPDGYVKDNSVLRMLENSLTDGALHQFRDPFTGRGDETKILEVVKFFWEAVAQTFPESWALPPRRSRLMHGAGIVAMGYVMDAIADRYRGEPMSVEIFREDLLPLKSICRWTDGYWDFGVGDVRRWNELQNTMKDTMKLANLLLVEYRRRVWCARSREESA